MTDKALENAKALKMQAANEITRLEDKLRYWRDRMAMSEHFIDQWNAFASGEPVNSGDSVPSEQNKTAPSTAPNRKVIRNSKKEDVAAAAREIIVERGKPIMRDELYGLLVARGLVIEGKDPQMVLSTMLWRTRDTIARLDNGYWPADIPNDEIGYDPQKNSVFDTMLNTEFAAASDDDDDPELPDDVQGLI